MSGYAQENYGVTHRGGNVVTVIENLKRLIAARSRTRANTEIHILYHRYLGNLDDEIKLRHLAAEWGINFKTAWAYLMPLEKTLAFAYNDTRYSPMFEEDREIIKRFALPFDEALAIGERNKHKACRLLEEQIVLDVNGDVILCCAVFEQSKYKIGNFLERPLEDIIRDKHQLENCKALCEVCTQKGLHVYATYDSPEFDQAAINNVSKHYAGALSIDTYFDRGILFFVLSKYAPKLLSAIRFIRRYARKRQWS
jgi:hypothetical protein